MLEWLFWQMGGLGPMAGQNFHFILFAPERLPYAIDRYVKETNRLYAVLDRRLADHEYLTDDYSIADMAAYPWIVPHERLGQKLEETPHLQRWYEAIRSRPATIAANAQAAPYSGRPVVTEEGKKLLFGQSGATITRP